MLRPLPWFVPKFQAASRHPCLCTMGTTVNRVELLTVSMDQASSERTTMQIVLMAPILCKGLGYPQDHTLGTTRSEGIPDPPTWQMRLLLRCGGNSASYALTKTQVLTEPPSPLSCSPAAHGLPSAWNMGPLPPVHSSPGQEGTHQSPHTTYLASSLPPDPWSPHSFKSM